MDPTPTTDRSFAKRAMSDVRTVTAFMTRLPADASDHDLARTSWAFPIPGLLVGSGGGGVFVLALWLSAPPLVAALLALASTAMLTGALHEDGLADTADGLGAANTERRLEIMRDSRIGAFGVLALVFSVGLRAAAIAAITAPSAGFTAMIAAAMLSRGLLPAMMHALPLASSTGLAAAAGRPGRGGAILACGLGLVAAIALLGPVLGIGALLLAALGVFVTALLARRLIGGYNGDTLGAAQQVAESAILIFIAAGFSGGFS